MFSKDLVRPYFAYVMNTILGDNLVGVTDQPFKIIPYNVMRIDFSKVNSLCCKSFPPNLKSLEIQNIRDVKHSEKNFLGEGQVLIDCLFLLLSSFYTFKL